MSAKDDSYVTEVFDEDHISSGLDRAIRDLLTECFPADSDVFPYTRYWNGLIPSYTVLHGAGEHVVGHVAVIVRTITAAGQPIAVAGPQNVAVAIDRRGSGLSRRLMDYAMAEADRRRVPFGLLFCLPELEPLYSAMGWRRTDRPVTIRDERDRSVPIPAKNIAMFLELADERFPEGALDLQGRDW